MAPAEIGPRIAELAQRFDLEDALDSLPLRLPLGIRQRLSLAVALIHRPEVLILDEPTSGVDPVARDIFWQALVDLSRQPGFCRRGLHPGDRRSGNHRLDRA